MDGALTAARTAATHRQEGALLIEPSSPRRTKTATTALQSRWWLASFAGKTRAPSADNHRTGLQPGAVVDCERCGMVQVKPGGV